MITTEHQFINTQNQTLVEPSIRYRMTRIKQILYEDGPCFSELLKDHQNTLKSIHLQEQNSFIQKRKEQVLKPGRSVFQISFFTPPSRY